MSNFQHRKKEDETAIVSGPSLTQRAARGFVWTSLAALSARLVQILTTLVLARLLIPDDFGVVAVALVVVNSLALMRDMGLSQALIHRRENIAAAADTAFILIPLTGLVLAGLTVLAAPAVAAFFEIPQAGDITRVLAIGLALSSFGLVPSTMLERELKFARKFIPEVAPVAGYSAAALTAAAMGLGAWSLVAGELARSALLATVIWPFSPWRPRLVFDLSQARALLSYGLHIVGAGVAIFIFTSLDNMGIAKGLGPEQLGFYVLAFTLGTMPATQVAYSVGKVLFPAYSSIQADRPALGRAFIRSVSYVSSVASPVALATVALGPVLLFTLYGEKWSGSVRALQILSFYGLFRAAGVAGGEILKSVGKPRSLALIAYVQLIAVAAALYPALKIGGIEGVALLFTLATAGGVWAALMLAGRATGVGAGRILAEAASLLLMSSLGALGAWAVSGLLLDGRGVLSLVAGTAAFILIYGVSLLIFRRGLVSELSGLVRGTLAPSAR